MCELVPPPAVAPDRLAGPALDREAHPLVGPDRALVEREHRQGDPVQAERAEGVVDHQRGRLGAVAVAPGVVLADRDVEQRRAVVRVELAERARADEPARRPHVDAHREASPGPIARIVKNRSISSGRIGPSW